MLVLKDLSIEIPGTNMHYIDLDSYGEPSEESALVYGYNNLHSNDLFDRIKSYKRKIYFNVTMPTEFCSDQNIYLDDKFDEIYTICPYSASWLNSVKDTDKYRFIWYPLDEKYTPPPQEKIFDVCYHGGIHGSKYVDMLNIISSFKYRYMTMTHGINQLTQSRVPLATDTNLSNEEKMLRISQCKISICFNNFLVRDERDLANIKSQPKWETNEAFRLAESSRMCPQIKSRVNEAAACNTLNLVEKDAWNVIEHFYEPDRHFLYFEDITDLQEKIFDISVNWDNYKHIAASAREHFVNNYTTERLYNRIKNNEDSSNWL
tara:strand:+ start:888 stop:1844 length:957 start_codon:yes stop_codon:yes gene_type:complete